MVEEFVKYAYMGDVIGQNVKTTELLYTVYCNLFNVEECDNIVNRICNKYDLFIERGVFCK